MKPQSTPDRADPPDRQARTVLPGLVHDRLRHLSVDLDVPLADLLVEGAVLLLRWHGLGTGLPEPTPPITLAVPVMPDEQQDDDEGRDERILAARERLRGCKGPTASTGEEGEP